MGEIGVKIRKVAIFSVKGCYRTICNHPFLVGMLCFLILLYRSFPFVFSILVSASPVLVCTAVLLGALLSFGQPNIPEIEKDERTMHEIVSLKTGFPRDDVVVQRDERCSVERYSDKGCNVVEKSTEEMSLAADETSNVGSHGSISGTRLPVEERSREIQLDGRRREEMQRGLQGLEYEQKNENFEARLGDMKNLESQYTLITECDDENSELENDRSPVGSVDSKVVNVDSLDSPPGSPWKHMDEGEEEYNEGDEASDYGSDRAESSSPDASMADILPMLDELHPLLDEDAPQQANLSQDGSDAASEHSARSTETDNESDDDTENQEDSDVAADDNEDGEYEEGAQIDKEDQTKPAITWTEEDQRNLMELGSSELERNRRLENLIARRRARKRMSVLPEKSLIDLESTDLPFTIPPITTKRTNPFDLPDDSNENMGLPLLPGSAPSILLPRRNPFDLPYDSSEEKPDLVGDSFEEEFVTLQSKDPFFRRHESFNIRPSLSGNNRPEKRNSRLRPYFVPEHMDSEGTSYVPFQRQSSDLSGSKMSSVPDTESNGSAVDLEEQNVTDEDTSVAEVRNQTKEDTSHEPELVSMIEDAAENIEQGSATEEETYVAEVNNHTVEDMSQEPELISIIEHVPENIGHGSESSEDADALEFGQVEKRHIKVDETDIELRDVENHLETELNLVAEQSVGNPLEVNMDEIDSNAKAGEQRYGALSSSSSLSEESERIYAVKGAEEFPTFVEGRDYIQEPSISAQPSTQGLHLNITSVRTDDNPHREPVYDASPTSVRKNFSSASISSDLHVESEISLPPVVVKRTVSFAGIESEEGSQDTESDSPVDKEMLAGSSEAYTDPADKSEMGSREDVEITEHDAVPVRKAILAGSSQAHLVYETEMRSSGDAETSQHDVVKYDVSIKNEIFDSAAASTVPETILVHASTDAKSSSDHLQEENLVSVDVTSQHARSLDIDTHVAVPDSVHSVSWPCDEQSLARLKEEQNSATHLTEGEALLSEQGVVQSDSDSVHHDADAIPTSSHHQHPPTENPVSLSAEGVALSDRSVYQPPSKDHKESLEPSSTVQESAQEVSRPDNWNHAEVQELDHKDFPDISIPTIPRSIPIPPEAHGTRALADEGMDGIIEIDDKLLSELVTVGDFCIKELGEATKGTDKYVEDTKRVSEPQTPGTSAVEQFSNTQYDHQEVDTVDLESTEAPKEKEEDGIENVLTYNPDAEETNSAMPEIEACSASDIESIFGKTVSTSMETEAVLRNLEMSGIESSLEGMAARFSEDTKVVKTSSQSEVNMETPNSEGKLVKDFDLDLNQLPQDNFEQIPVSDSVQISARSKDKEGTSEELQVLEKASQDVSNDGGSSKGVVSDVKACDVQEITQHAHATPGHEIKVPEGQDVATSDANSLKENSSKIF